MNPKYFDIHSHLNHPDYEKDFNEVITRLKDADTYTIVVGTDYETSQRAVELADKYDEIYACIGQHPVDRKDEPFDTRLNDFFGQVSKYERLVKHHKVVAVGECGLDFKHADKEQDYERQKELFSTQIDFALKHNKPLMIHARDAYEEILEILEPLGSSTSKLRGNVHFFTGDLATAKRFFAIGFTISFTGVITFTRDYDEVIKEAPITHILSETDAPYIAPVPYRGQRNEPAYVDKVVERMALIREEDKEEVRKALVKNAKKLFSILP